MKREILFRGKSIEYNKWVFGSLLVDWCGVCRICEKNISGNLNNYTVHQESVGQFTGILVGDIKMFEGDILKRNLRFNLIVEWSIKYSQWMFVDPFDCNWDKTIKDIEIIGNDFDNPELMDVRYW
jgi:hypothetical protein